MHCRAVFLVLLFAIFWQSVALARPGSTVNALADPAHTALHWQEEGHHHHDDGSYHQDDSSESVQHVLSDHLNATAACTSSPANGLPFLPSAAPLGLHQTPVPDPTLDGLLRPPRSRA
jgi:hypothetical protein